MAFIMGLHGAVAVVLICSLLFVDEAGVPIPFAPSEGLLLLTGVLIATGAFPPWVAIPAIAAAMLAGMLSGYSWARVAGQAGLRAIAQRFSVRGMYDRVEERLRSAGPVGIGVCRILPGLRPYATLVSGAAGVPLRTFLLGAIPALLVWELGLIFLGFAVGLPAEHLLGRVEKLALRGGLLLVLGVGAWLAIKHVPKGEQGALGQVLPRYAVPIALLLDAGIVASVVTGAFAIGRHVAHTTMNGWIELLVIVFVMGSIPLLQWHIDTPGELLAGGRYGQRSPSTG